MSKVSLKGLVEKIRSSRESSLCSEGELSIEYYKNSLQQLGTYIGNIKNPTLEKKFEKVRGRIRQEFEVSNNLYQIQRVDFWKNPLKDPIVANQNQRVHSPQYSSPVGLSHSPQNSPVNFPVISTEKKFGGGGPSSKLQRMRQQRKMEKIKKSKKKKGKDSNLAKVRGRKNWGRRKPSRFESSPNNRSEKKEKNSGKEKPSKEPEKPGKSGEEQKGDEGGEGKKDEPKKFDGGPLLHSLVEVIERDIIDTNIKVTWDNIAGLDSAKKLLKEAVVLPLWMPNFFQGIREPWHGVLMFGPPGTGKTMLAKAVATECHTTFFNVSLAAVTSKWRGESEKLIRLLFEMARFYAPSTIFIDEIDALCSTRGSGEHEASRRVKTELLVQMDGIHKGAGDSDSTDLKKIVLVLGATNHPWDLDQALRRRLEKRVYIPLPDLVARKKLFEMFTKTVKLSEDVKIDELADRSEGYSAHDIYNICRDASMMKLRGELVNITWNKETLETAEKNILEKEISMGEFNESFKNTQSSVNSDDVSKYENWMGEYGSKV